MPEQTLVFSPEEADKVKNKKLTDVYEFTAPMFREGDICHCITETDIIPFAYARIMFIHRHNFDQILPFDAYSAGYPSLEEFKQVLTRKSNFPVTESTKVWHIIFELVRDDSATQI